MYFVSINRLKDDIMKGKLTDGAALPYYLIYVIPGYFVFDFVARGFSIPIPITEFLGSNAVRNMWDWIGFAASVSIFTLGNIFAFKANKGSEGRDFLNRLFSIGFVVGVRFIPVIVGVIILATFLDAVFYQPELYTADDDTYIPASPVVEIPLSLAIAAVYWRICKHISDVANATPQSA